MVGRKTSPINDIYIPIPNTLPGKRDSVGVIKLRVSRWPRLPWIIPVRLMSSQELGKGVGEEAITGGNRHLSDAIAGGSHKLRTAQRVQAESSQKESSPANTVAPSHKAYVRL